MSSFNFGEVRQLVGRLTNNQRDFLLNHIDTAIAVNVSLKQQTWVAMSLIKHGLLRGEPAAQPRPRHTVLTEAGRYAVAILLADYAETLVRAGYLEAVAHPGRAMSPIESSLMFLQGLKRASVIQPKST